MFRFIVFLIIAYMISIWASLTYYGDNITTYLFAKENAERELDNAKKECIMRLPSNQNITEREHDCDCYVDEAIAPIKKVSVDRSMLVLLTYPLMKAGIFNPLDNNNLTDAEMKYIEEKCNVKLSSYEHESTITEIQTLNNQTSVPPAEPAPAPIKLSINQEIAKMDASKYKIVLYDLIEGDVQCSIYRITLNNNRVNIDFDYRGGTTLTLTYINEETLEANGYYPISLPFLGNSNVPVKLRFNYDGTARGEWSNMGEKGYFNIGIK